MQKFKILVEGSRVSFLNLLLLAVFQLFYNLNDTNTSVVPVPKHKPVSAYRGSGGSAPCILNLSTGWSRVVSLTLQSGSVGKTCSSSYWVRE
jgi:hypothetical protein